MLNTLRLSDIYIFPVKSLAGIRVSASKVELRGLQYDRRWVITDPEGQFFTQRTTPEMALIGTAIEPPFLILFDRFNTADRIAVPLEPPPVDEYALEVAVWDDRMVGSPVDTDADEWLSDKLGQPVRLVAMPHTTERPVDPKYAPDGQLVSFADAYPFLIIGQASLDDLNARLDKPVPMNRFRPNLVFEGGQPYEEDNWKEFTIGDISFKGVKPCARCIMTTVNQDTAQKGAEPLKTLSTYRFANNKVLFGQNVIFLGQEGSIKIGDSIVVVP
jgi:uncharacterized protein